eukprot:7391953-Prymnesium_polylepis.4
MSTWGSVQCVQCTQPITSSHGINLTVLRQPIASRHSAGLKHCEDAVAARLRDVDVGDACGAARIATVSGIRATRGKQCQSRSALRAEWCSARYFCRQQRRLAHVVHGFIASPRELPVQQSDGLGVLDGVHRSRRGEVSVVVVKRFLRPATRLGALCWPACTRNCYQALRRIRFGLASELVEDAAALLVERLEACLGDALCDTGARMVIAQPMRACPCKGGDRARHHEFEALRAHPQSSNRSACPTSRRRAELARGNRPCWSVSSVHPSRKPCLRLRR